MTSIRVSDLEGGDEDLFVHQEITVDKGQSPTRIDKFLMMKLDQVSRNRVQNAISVGSILVNGKEVKSNYKVKPQDHIALVLPRNPDDDAPLEPQYIPLNIVYEDDDVMVINKQPGLVVHPGVGNMDQTLVNALLYHFGEQGLTLFLENKQRPGIVHRIDKDTSGLMVIAKTELAMTHLAKQFFDHTIDRSYVALVWGQPEEEKGTIDAPIGRHARERKQMTVVDEMEGGKSARTHYEVLEPLYYVSLIKCQLETGRTHQIRVHMKHIGHTLFNDDRYGGDKILKGTVFTKYKQFVDNCFAILPRQALHAKSLGFTHPTTGKRMFFDSDLPEDFVALLDKWRAYKNSRTKLEDE
ncbi:MAG: RluA family pseudouridine synthase [Saprospiraceae bacterium]|nr:RluA family pseudouridine synthase [Saprospiraceae bacterium]